MKLAVDCRLIGRSGIGTFIENVTEEFICNHPENKYVLIGDPKNLSRWKDKDCCKIVESNAKQFSLNELLRFPTKEVNKCDAFFTPDFNIPMGIKVPINSMIHDIVFFDMGVAGNALRRIIIHKYISRALRISANVITVSKFSKSRIESVFQIRKDIHVVNSAINEKLKAYKQKYYDANEKREGIVFLGNLKKHKGIRTLLEAYNLLENEGWHKPLTIIGKMNFRSKDDSIASMIKNSRGKVKLVSNATDNDVFNIISHSEVLVSPSMYEGFGLPPLEALYLGTPAIISDIPVYKEVYAELPVTFFKVNDAKDLADKLCTFKPQVMDVANKIDELYSFKRAANELLSIF